MKEYNIPYLKYHTHIYQYGKLDNKHPVVILLHGGPGGNTRLIKPLTDLSKHGFTVITYDQLGSLKSSSIKGKKELFKVSTFVNELDNVINELNIKRFHLLGHSWGGMLALEYIINKNPKGLDKLILFSSLSSAKVWTNSNMKNFLNHLDPELSRCFKKAYKDKDEITMNRIYKKYIRKYYRVKTNTSPYIKDNHNLGKSEEIYEYMWGPVDPIATSDVLKNWDVTVKLKKIKNPTLILYGKYDQSTKEVNELMHKNIKNSKLVYLGHSAHIGYYNEYQKSINSIVKFLK